MAAIGLAVVGAVISSAITLTPLITNLALAAPRGALSFANESAQHDRK